MFYTYPIPTEQDKLGQLYMILIVMTFLTWAAGDSPFLLKLSLGSLWSAAIILTCRYFNLI